MQAVKAVMSLCSCAGSPESSLLDIVISTQILCTGLFMFIEAPLEPGKYTDLMGGYFLCFEMPLIDVRKCDACFE